MNKLLDLILFVVVVAFLWWVLAQVLAILAVPAPLDKLAVLAFIVITALAAFDYFRNKTPFWRRP